MDLEDLLDKVCDQESFCVFVQALIQDRKAAVIKEGQTASSAYEADAGGWENTTIEAFLDTALAWAKDTQMGALQGLSQEPSWKVFATFLYCGKIYE